MWMSRRKTVELSVERKPPYGVEMAVKSRRIQVVCCYCPVSLFGRQLHNAAPRGPIPFSHRKGEWSTNEGGEFRVRAKPRHAIPVFCVGIGRIVALSLHYRYIIQREVRLKKKE